MRGVFTRPNDFYLPSLQLAEGGGVSTLRAQPVEKTFPNENMCCHTVPKKSKMSLCTSNTFF
jgi:hypothetical protein